MLALSFVKQTATKKKKKKVKGETYHAVARIQIIFRL